MKLHTPEEIANARASVARYDWARAEADAVVEASQPFVAMSDEALWSLITGQQVPRGIHANPDLGCPECGREVYERFGNYPWIVSLGRPWKLECPSCGRIWPENDFGAYHDSGLGPGGVFHRDRADASLLYNAQHPDPGDPLHGFAVDDGIGWMDEDGNPWRFIAYYSHYGTWGAIPKAVSDLARAYLFTGEPIYAHKGAVLLDRIADVYPDMDLKGYSELGFYNSSGGSGEGRIKGCIWETGLSEELSRAADILRDGMAGDRELVTFLSGKARQWDLTNDKSSLGRIRDNVENNLLREFILSCRDFRIRGNEGMTQTAMAVAAAVLDDPEDTPRALDWLFEPGARGSGGGHIPATLIGQVDRDGVGNEASPSYSFIWLNLFRRCAEALERCQRHHRYDLYRDFPRLRRMHAAPYRLTCLDKYTPHVGDTGRTGDPGMTSVDLDTALDAYARFGDAYFAQLAHRLNGDRVEGLHSSICHAAPEAVQAQIQQVVEREGPIELDSTNLNGYGLALFRHGRGPDQRAAYLYYGRNGGHGHRDRLNFGLYYRGMDLLPDLGYPEYADSRWPKRAGWTLNTISHNTVVVDRRQQETSWIGRCRLFAHSDGVGVAEVGCGEAYPETEDYRRTLALIDLSGSESYLIDFTRVAGGEDHVASFHAGEGEVTTQGLALDDQTRGTYAGEDIAFGSHYDGAPDGRYRGSGFAYLRDVKRQENPLPGWHLDWRLDDAWATRLGDADVNLRYHGLAPIGDLALAQGEPPRNKPGNPQELAYVLQHNTGPDLRSFFVSVIEPYSGGRPNLAAVKRLDLDLPDDDLVAAAVHASTPQGRTDLVLSSDDPHRSFDLGNGVRAAGRFILISRETDGSSTVFALGGTRVKLPEGTLEMDTPAYEGTVIDLQREEAGPAWMDVEADLPAGDRLLGAQIRVHANGPRDTCYAVDGVEPRAPGVMRLHMGDTTFVRGLQSETDYSQGYLYDFEPGDSCDIQTLVHCRLDADGLSIIRATADCTWQRAGEG